MKVFLSNNLLLCAAAMAVGILGDTKVHAQPGGVPLWTNRYDGPGNSVDEALAIAVDGNGNVFVAGESVGSGSFYDYATIKYSSAGAPLWTNRYDGPGNEWDRATAIAVDSIGNVIVTGSSVGNGSYNDYATIKYSEAGVPMWTNRYDGPRNSDDSATAVSVDVSDNVFVTGSSIGNGSYNDYATIKYSSAGVPLWTNRYNGPADSDDGATAVAVDDSGNVFVTGSSASANVIPFNYDYATIAYSGAGVPLWTNRYNGVGNSADYARALAVDGSGNVVVAGDSGSLNPNYSTIKYSSAGVPLWTNLYSGPGIDADRAGGAALDGGGNVIVTGYSRKSNNDDCATIKYSSAGVPLWTNLYAGMGGLDYGRAIAVDGSGNVLLTGNSSNTNGPSFRYDYATIAYSNAGLPLWTNRYNGPGDGDDYPAAIAVDGSGNVFVTGKSWNGISSDYATIKYSSMGGPLLTIARTTTNTVALCWPSPAADFTLQQNTNVATTNWTAVGTIPADDRTNKTVIIDPPEGNRFYRLFRP